MALTLVTSDLIGGLDYSKLTGTVPTWNQNTTGSAATLTTARNIGGVSFNGSAAINLPGVNAAGNQNTSGTAAGLSATLAVGSGGTGVTSITALKNVLDDETWTFANNTTFAGNIILPQAGVIAFNSTSDEYITASADHLFFGTGNLARLTIDGANVGIGTTSPSSKLTVVGGTSNFVYDNSPQGTASSVYRDAIFGSTQTVNTGITIFGTGQGGISFGDAGSNIRGQVRYQHSSDTLELGAAGNINLSISSGGTVSVSNPSSSTGSAAAGRLADSSVHLVDTTHVGRYSQITFGYPTSNTHASAYIGYVSTSNSASGKGDLVFGAKNDTAYNTQPSERMRIESDGTVRVKTGSIVVDTSGQGIYLGGTATANNLDHYEEGSWTPSLSTTGGSVGTSSSAGQYTKIGRQVIVHFQFTLSSSSGGSGTLKITNLPFTVNANSGAVIGAGRILDLGQIIVVGHYTSTHQIGMNKYDGAYAGTDYFTTGFVTYYVA